MTHNLPVVRRKYQIIRLDSLTKLHFHPMKHLPKDNWNGRNFQFLDLSRVSQTRLIQHYHKIPSGVLTHPSHPSLPPQSPSPTPASAYFLLKRSLVIFKIKTIDSCLSESIDHCLRHGSCTGKIVYEMQKWNNWNSNICYSLDARRTYSDISTESVVQTNNWESRHNFLALEEVKQRLCFASALLCFQN